MSRETTDEKEEREERAAAAELRDQRDQMLVLIVLTRANAPLRYEQIRTQLPVSLTKAVLYRHLDEMVKAAKITEVNQDRHLRKFCVKINPDRLLPWQQSWNGKHWYDMPGQCEEMKKLNFFLFRTGKDEYVKTFMEGGKERQRQFYSNKINAHRKLKAQRDAEKTGTTAAAAPAAPRINNGFQALPITERQIGLQERWNAAKRPWGWCEWFENHTGMRGEQLSAFRNGKRGISAAVLDRVEAALEADARGEAVVGRRSDRMKKPQEVKAA